MSLAKKFATPNSQLLLDPPSLVLSIRVDMSSGFVGFPVFSFQLSVCCFLFLGLWFCLLLADIFARLTKTANRASNFLDHLRLSFLATMLFAVQLCN